MRDVYTAKLSRLSDEVLEMGNLCGQAIMKTCQLLASVEVREAATKEIGRIEKEIDDKEHNIEALCMQLLLKQQPVGTDLRKISAALKMVTDMERIGDHATDISELAIVLSEKTYVKKLDHIEKMARETMVMLIQSLEAYVEKDLDKAQKVIAHDDVIDDLFEEVKQELIELIRNHADEGEQAVDLLMVTKYFERIGDHATNIAEWVIFSITGQIAG